MAFNKWTKKNPEFKTQFPSFSHTFPATKQGQKKNFEAQKLSNSPQRQNQEHPFGSKPWRPKSRESREGGQEWGYSKRGGG